MTLPVHYAAALLFDDLIVQGQDHVLRCPLYRDGELVQPSGGTVSVYDTGRRAVVDAAAVTVGADQVATYTIPGSTTAGLPRREGWSVEWLLEIDGERVPPIRNKAALVLTHLYPVVTDEVIWRRMPALDPRNPDSITSRTTFQPQIAEAWADIIGRLAATGNRPNLITSPAALREVHVDLTVALILEDLASRLNEGYQELADRWRERFETAWQRLSFDYDSNDDGKADKRKKPTGGWWLCGRDR